MFFLIKLTKINQGCFSYSFCFKKEEKNKKYYTVTQNSGKKLPFFFFKSKMQHWLCSSSDFIAAEVCFVSTKQSRLQESMGTEESGSLICSLHIGIVMLLWLKVQSAALTCYIHSVVTVIMPPQPLRLRRGLYKHCKGGFIMQKQPFLKNPFCVVKNKCYLAVYKPLILQLSKLHL